MRCSTVSALASARVAGAGVWDALEGFAVGFADVALGDVELGDAALGDVELGEPDACASEAAPGFDGAAELAPDVVTDGEVACANAACGKASIVPPSNAASAMALPNCAGTASGEVEADIGGVPF
jgi:hypothetical protein